MGAKTSTGCEVLSCRWFSQSGELRSLGVVLIQCEYHKVAYIGVGTGMSERADAVHVAETGSKLPKEIAAAFFRCVDLSDYKPS